jgi:hypothetical protein
MGKLSNTLTVYWAPYSNNELPYQLAMLDIVPKSFMSDIQSRKVINKKYPQNRLTGGGGYQACSAMHTAANNLFILKSPISAELTFDKNGTIDRSTKNNNWFTERESSFENSFCFDLECRYIFFSEEPVNMTFTPPYLHKPKCSEFGAIVPGQMDISSWFSRIPSVFQLWENENKFKINFNEPIAYLKFDTDKKVELKQFKLTNELFNQANACGNLKQVIQFQSMAKLYDRFKKAGMKDAILNEIKRNLI